MKEINEVEAAIQPENDPQVSVSKPEISPPTALDESFESKPVENIPEPNSDVPSVSIENQATN